MRRTITEARRLRVCLTCGKSPAVADGDSLALYCAKHHGDHAAKWNEKKENDDG